MIKVWRFLYLTAAWLFLAGVVTQVYLAGMVVVARKISWSSHMELGHILAGPLLLMLVFMYLGRQPGHVKRLNWLLFLVYVLQADVLIFLRVQAPLLSALHPVLALFDFALGLILAQKAWPLAMKAPAPSALQAEPHSSAEG